MLHGPLSSPSHTPALTPTSIRSNPTTLSLTFTLPRMWRNNSAGLIRAGSSPSSGTAWGRLWGLLLRRACRMCISSSLSTGWGSLREKMTALRCTSSPASSRESRSRPSHQLPACIKTWCHPRSILSYADFFPCPEFMGGGGGCGRNYTKWRASHCWGIVRRKKCGVLSSSCQRVRVPPL